MLRSETKGKVFLRGNGRGRPGIYCPSSTTAMAGGGAGNKEDEKKEVISRILKNGGGGAAISSDTSASKTASTDAAKEARRKKITQKLGMADDEECEVPACRTMLDVLSSASSIAAARKKKAPTATTSSKKEEGGKEEEDPLVLAQWRRENCPLGREALGDATWGLLHSTAAYYPEKASTEQQSVAKGLIKGIAEFYPCTHCREDFEQSIQEVPPRVDTREAFSIWLCHQHNLVNEKIGKPLFKCTLSNLDTRWRKGVAKCWSDPTSTSSEEEAGLN